MFFILGLNVSFQTGSGVWKVDELTSICMGSPKGLMYENDVKYTLAKYIFGARCLDGLLFTMIIYWSILWKNGVQRLVEFAVWQGALKLFWRRMVVQNLKMIIYMVILWCGLELRLCFPDFKVLTLVFTHWYPYNWWLFIPVLIFWRDFRISSYISNRMVS